MILEYQGRYNCQDGPDNCIIDSEDSVRAFIVRGNEIENATIMGIKVIRGARDFGAAVIVVTGTPHFEDCTFENNRAEFGGGAVFVELGGGLTMTNCRFLKNDPGTADTCGSKQSNPLGL